MIVEREPKHVPRSILLAARVATQPSIEPAEGTFTEAEGCVGSVFDLRHSGPSNAGKERKLAGIELAVGEPLGQEEESGKGRG